VAAAACGPAAAPSPLVLFGSHDGLLRCADACTGALQWALAVDSAQVGAAAGAVGVTAAGAAAAGAALSPLFAAPCVASLRFPADADAAAAEAEVAVVCACTTGQWPAATAAGRRTAEAAAAAPAQGGAVCVVEVRTGRLLGRRRLPGEVFSSPVLCNGSVLVGCRDDRFMALEMQPRYL
jgi:hypothetical protein